MDINQKLIIAYLIIGTVETIIFMIAMKYKS